MTAHVYFADERLRAECDRLRNGKGDERQLYDALLRAIDQLIINPYRGTRIARRLIPKEYRQQYGINNLWKYDLPRGWRLLYAIRNQEVLVIAVIIEWMTHKEYERRLKY